MLVVYLVSSNVNELQLNYLQDVGVNTEAVMVAC